MGVQPLENWFDLVTLLACCGTAAGAYYWGSVRAQIQQQKHPKAKGSHKARTEEGANFNGPGALLPNTIFQQAINHSAGSLVICDAQQPDLPIVYVSPSFENLTGYEAEEVLGKNCRFLQGDEQQQLGIQEVRKAIAAGTGYKVLLHNYRKTGQPFWNELTLSPIANESGVITHYVGTQVDISHHLETFKALEHSNARYRHLYEETPAMMHSVDRRGRIVSMSHCWLETLGYERGDVIGQPLANFLAQKAPQTIENILLSLESKKVDRNRLCQFVKKRGDRIDVLLSTMAECSENPRSGSTFGVLVDITERRKAKEKLRRSEALLRAINNLPPTGIFVMDCHTNEALFINSEFYRIWQLEHLKDAVEQGEITGEQLLTECLSNIDLGRFVATSTDQDFTHGNKIVEDEVPMLDGRTLRRIYGPIQENDSTFAYLYIFEDITERKQAVQKLALATESAEAANRAKSEFLANMSHELRSPLNAILGFTHILQNDSLTSAQKENLDIIYNSSEHLLALINDILDISKIEARRVVLAHSEFDLYRLIEELQQMFSGVVAQKNLALVVERSPDLPRIIHSDRLKLRQILINLLSNAVKFTATGTITLSVTAAVDSGAHNHTEYGASDRPNQDHIALTFAVTDTGAGIAPADQDRLFEAFVQAQSALTGQQGTGLGLAISHEYIQLLGGQLNVESMVGKGSTFSFSLGVRPVKTLLERPDHQSEPTVTGKIIGLEHKQPAYRILVVDDVALNRKLLTHLLCSVGFEVREAKDGQAAIAQWQTWQPHLIWMDIRMPVMSGEEAALRIKAQDTARTTRIIALTANAFDEDKNTALASGCDDFVSKPIRAHEVFEKTAQHLGVRYRYAETEAVPSQSVGQLLTTDLLATTSAKWRYGLTQAILDLDDEKILELAGQLPVGHEAIAAAIRQKVQNLDYKTLLQLLQAVDQEAEALNP